MRLRKTDVKSKNKMCIVIITNYDVIIANIFQLNIQMRNIKMLPKPSIENFYSRCVLNSSGTSYLVRVAYYLRYGYLQM